MILLITAALRLLRSMIRMMTHRSMIGIYVPELTFLLHLHVLRYRSSLFSRQVFHTCRFFAAVLFYTILFCFSPLRKAARFSAQ